MDEIKEAFFLHGGPGLNAGIERLWFGRELPMRWWDQPNVAGEADPFDVLVEAAADQLAQIAADQPVRLIAHSFGGQIAYALARKQPKLIRRITLLGCAVDPASAIVRLCHRAAAVSGSTALTHAISIYEADLNLETFKAMVIAGATDPAYPSVYFGPGSAAARDRYQSLLPQVAPLDVATFLDVINGFLRPPSLDALPAFCGEVDLVMGRHDPVLSLDADVATWRRVFPQARLVTVEAGHFIQLETEPAVWFAS